MELTSGTPGDNIEGLCDGGRGFQSAQICSLTMLHAGCLQGCACLQGTVYIERFTKCWALVN